MKQIKKKMLIKHTDGVTNVIAKVWVSSDHIDLNYVLDKFSWCQQISLSQAVKLGIIECSHPCMNPILGFENEQIGEICVVCNKEMMFRDEYNQTVHNKVFDRKSKNYESIKNLKR